MPTKFNTDDFKSRNISFSYLVIGLLVVLFTTNVASAQGNFTEIEHPDYVAEINEINSNLIEGKVSGSVSFKIADGQLYVNMKVKGLPPTMRPLIIIHGSQLSYVEPSTCPTPDADTNNDGIIDLIETRKVSGFMLIPMNSAPANLRISSSGYPAANENGLLTYQVKIPMNKLKFMIQRKYGIKELSLEERVIYVHGVPNYVSLPESVATIPVLPVRMSVPVACGNIETM